MQVIIYGDFNCPYCYLASQRADRLIHRGLAQVGWRAVEHDRQLALTGTPSEADSAAWKRELAEVAELALPGEDVPAAPPPLVSNTGAAVAAYAEAVTDGIADELRRGLSQAIWVHGQHVSGANEVRRLVRNAMWPSGDLAGRLGTPDLPGPLNRDRDLARIVRRSGGTIATDGGPLTTAGWARLRQWRTEWLALPNQTIPAVIGPDRILRSGVEGLRYLADIASAVGPPRVRGPAVAVPGHRPAAATAA